MPSDVLGKKVGPIGYGMLGLTWRGEPLPEERAFAALRESISHGANMWNGGQIYGPRDNNSLTLLRAYYEKYPEDVEKVVLSIKGGLTEKLEPIGTPEYVRESVESSLESLGPKGKIDMFEYARVDPNVPIETTIKALKGLVDEGKIGGVSLSEVSAQSIRRAAKITKIVAVEVELSLWCLDPLNNGITDACHELGIPIIAYSPIGRGFLTGNIKSIDDIPEGDLRRHLPRMQPGNFEINMKLVEEIQKIAIRKNATPAQIAIGWLVALSKKPGMPEIIPIPGSSDPERVKVNSQLVVLDEADMKEIEGILARFKPVGERYHEHGMKLING